MYSHMQKVEDAFDGVQMANKPLEVNGDIFLCEHIDGALHTCQDLLSGDGKATCPLHRILKFIA